MRLFYHAILDKFKSNRYLNQGLKKFHNKIRTETFAEKEIVDGMLLDDDVAAMILIKDIQAGQERVYNTKVQEVQHQIADACTAALDHLNKLQ